MWICKNCSEENEDSFDTCWKCLKESDIGLEKSIVYHKELKEENKRVSEKEKKESFIFWEMEKKKLQIWVVSILGGLFIGGFVISFWVYILSVFINTDGLSLIIQGLTLVIIHGSIKWIKESYSKHLKEKIINQMDSK
jgi:hypothetical protein|tara:strand:- start:766 stop:1179 length:414 start_codon:yes stop_codon:yes gene_type:complete